MLMILSNTIQSIKDFIQTEILWVIVENKWTDKGVWNDLKTWND